MELDYSREAAERRRQWIHAATSEVGQPVDVQVHLNHLGHWTVSWDHQYTPIVSRAMRLVMIREGHPEMLVCDACVAAAGPGFVWIRVAESCHHLDWMVTA